MDGGWTALVGGGWTALVDGGLTALVDEGLTALVDGGLTALVDGDLNCTGGRGLDCTGGWGLDCTDRIAVSLRVVNSCIWCWLYFVFSQGSLSSFFLLVLGLVFLLSCVIVIFFCFFPKSNPMYSFADIMC